MKRHLRLATNVVLGMVSSLGSSQDVGSEVQTTSGLVKGHVGPLRPEVFEYLGVPYASPPLGDLRFAAPIGLNSTQTILAESYVGKFKGHRS